MLDSMEAPGGTSTGIDSRLLPPGIEVVVDTNNSRYRFVMGDGNGSNAVVQGGRYFLEETEVRIAGSTYGGSFLKIAWIELGLCLELSVSGTRIVTSPVRSICVAG